MSAGNIFERDADKRIAELEAENERLRHEKAEWYQTAQRYRLALQEIRDRTPANQHDEWPHHHWYLATASHAINHCDGEQALSGEEGSDE
jgi:hypothetical protein